MSEWLITLSATFVLFALALIGLGIGRIFTGKTRISKGCGVNPQQKMDPSCQKEGACHLCHKDKAKECDETQK